MIYREAEKELQLLSAQFKAVAVTGPRQSGKTTLVKKVFKEKAYVNLENPDLCQFAREDPRGFSPIIPTAPYWMKCNVYRNYFRIYNKYWMKRNKTDCSF
jgi:Cdc6-like AAA superfamily ATPase